MLWLETSAPGPPDRHSYRFEPRLGVPRGAATRELDRRRPRWKRRIPELPRALADRRAAARRAPADGADGAGGRAPDRGLAEPDLADRARQGEPVGQHAVEPGHGARAARWATCSRREPPRAGATTTEPVAARVARINLETGVRWERLTATSDPLVEFLSVVYPPGAASCDERLAHAPRRQGVRLRRRRPARGAGRVRRVRARARAWRSRSTRPRRTGCGPSATSRPRRSGWSSAARPTRAGRSSRGSRGRSPASPTRRARSAAPR